MQSRSLKTNPAIEIMDDEDDLKDDDDLTVDTHASKEHRFDKLEKELGELKQLMYSFVKAQNKT